MYKLEAKDFISAEIPVATPEDTIAEILQAMHAAGAEYLPLVENGKYLCLLSGKDLSEIHGTSDKPVPVGCFTPSVTENGYILEVLNQLTQAAVSLLPVVSSAGEYIGSIRSRTVLNHLAELCQAGHPGAVIVLRCQPDDYSLADIVRHIEENHCKMINFMSFSDSEKKQLYLCLKTDCEEINTLARTLERFDYDIVGCFMHRSEPDETLRQRLDELMYYIKM